MTTSLSAAASTSYDPLRVNRNVLLQRIERELQRSQSLGTATLTPSPYVKLLIFIPSSKSDDLFQTIKMVGVDLSFSTQMSSLKSVEISCTQRKVEKVKQAIARIKELKVETYATFQPRYTPPRHCPLQNTRYKLIIFVPTALGDIVRQIIGDAGAGLIGKYSFCSFSTSVVLQQGNGCSNAERIESVCSADAISAVNKGLQAVEKVNPGQGVHYEFLTLIEPEENDSLNLVKMSVFCPKLLVKKVREAMEKAAGRVNGDESVAYSVEGTGRWLPLSGARSAQESGGLLVWGDEQRIDLVCHQGKTQPILAAAKANHCYEEVGCDIYPLDTNKAKKYEPDEEGWIF